MSTATTPQDLVDILVENIDRVRDGSTTHNAANAIVASVGGILRLTKQQMDYARLTNTTPDIPLLRSGK